MSLMLWLKRRAREMVMAAGALEERFTAYVAALASTLAHIDRKEPFSAYCRGLLLPGERKSVEPTAPQRRDYRRHWTPVHLDFVVPDVVAAVRRAEAAGARLEEEIRTHEWGRIAVMADPFGHGFCLVEFVGRGYDALTTS